MKLSILKLVESPTSILISKLSLDDVGCGVPWLQDDGIRLGADHNSGSGLDLAAVLRSQLETEVPQKVGQEGEELHHGDFLSWALPLADTESDEALTLGNEVTSSI